MSLSTPIKKRFDDEVSLSKIFELCQNNKLLKLDVKKLKKYEIPVIDQSFYINDWKLLSKRLEEYVYCIWIISASQGNELDSLVIHPKDIQNIDRFLEEENERTVIGLSLFAHSLRLSHWIMADLVLKGIHEIELLEISERLKSLIENSCMILSDPRVIDIFSAISGVHSKSIAKILKEKQFKIRFVEIAVPVKGWITPVEIVFNLELMTIVETNVPHCFCKITWT
jgi:hypothetical protein